MVGYSEKAVRNSFAAVKKEIEEVKARQSLMDAKLKNSFANFKSDVNSLKESVEGLKGGKDNFISLGHFNGKLEKINAAISAIRDDFSRKGDSLNDDLNGIRSELGWLKKERSSLAEIRSELKALNKARARNSHDFEKEIDSLRAELDVSSELKRLEKKISEPVVKEVVVEKPVVKEIVKEVIKEKPAKKGKKASKDKKGAFSKMIDFFAEE